MKFKSLDDYLCKVVVLLTFVLGCMAIGIAWASQIWGGLVPCELCLGERIPYYVALPIVGVVLLSWSRLPPLLRRLALVLVAAIFAWSAYLGVFHAGVEMKLWEVPTACAATPQSLSTDLLTALDQVKVIPCDQIQWQLFGISMADINAGLSLLIAALLILAARPSPGSQIPQSSQDQERTHSSFAADGRPAH